MKFLYGLTLALIFIEGFISQCEGAGEKGKASSSTNIHDVPLEVVELIISRTGSGFCSAKEAARLGIDTLEPARRLIKNSIIYIFPVNGTKDIFEYKQNGKMYIRIDVNKVPSLFKNFGDYMTKIKVEIDGANNDIRSQIYGNIFEYSEKFRELHIITNYSFLAFLDKLSNGGKIQFSKVTKLRYEGPNFGKSYDLNSKFPSLEKLSLFTPWVTSIPLSYPQMKIDMDCMKKVRKLNELKLEFAPSNNANDSSYNPYELEDIFKKNKQLSTLGIVLTRTIDILYLIEAHVKNLETLEIHVGGTGFLSQVPRDRLFEIQKLERLNLKGMVSDYEFISFINSFRKIKILDVMILNDFLIEKIDKFNEIEEIITYDNTGIKKFERALKIFGKKNQLNTVRWLNVDKPNRWKYYKSEANRINEEFKLKSQKPTWKIYFSENEGPKTMTLVRRN